MYIGLPAAVSDAEWNGLVGRMLERRRMEREFRSAGLSIDDAKFKARGLSVKRRELSLQGVFSDWLLATWWRIVGSGDNRHRYRGADVMPNFWSEKAEREADRTWIAEYFWRESGKFGQKTPPGNFGGLRFYGRWGSNQGFRPVEGSRSIDARVFVELRRLYRRQVDGQMQAAGKRTGRQPRRFRGPRGRDGLTVFVRDAPTFAGMCEEWATAFVIGKGEHGVARFRKGCRCESCAKAMAVHRGPGRVREKYWDALADGMVAPPEQDWDGVVDETLRRRGV
jgi:hypothetical protein